MNHPPAATRRDTEPPSATVIENVAVHKGTDALLLDPPLYDVLDPDALDALFRDVDGARRTGEVSFEYCGCHVTVGSDGRVLVEDADDDERGSPSE
ncbi:HalOD1 output domain-containing protein [Halorarum salinum]|uniref:Halobacterial output domain-containing protein n=1 Tax=Halorarum salinum TaxID=2743089 RepID=A0A7D5L9D6_9EURY|nr:HalOD1 output domain-containing protein [Halobaculum salinum]QLG61253.1 hypothetical protein HUG12_05700 [Halobaculum salinum]